MKTKQQKGKEIAKSFEIKFDGTIWIVPSESGNGEYEVDLQRQICACPYFQKNKAKCKHQFAVEEKIWREFRVINPDRGKQAIRGTPRKKRNWAGYNEAQTKERGRWLELLYELCAQIPEPPKKPGRGRTPLPLAEVLFCLILKVYERNCSRRFTGYLGESIARGFITRQPHFNSICNYFRKDWMTFVLSDLVTFSSLPLAAIETSFSVDSSGFGTSQKERWYDVKYGNSEDWHGWIKAHIICGNLTKTVVSIIISPAYANDSPFFIPLVGNAARYFQLEEVLADAAYSSKENLEFVEGKKAKVFIPFKSNAVVGTKSEVWNKLLHFYSFHQTEFHERYKNRSNVETAFSAIKLKFGENLRSFAERGQINELLAKIVCHNLSVLVRSIYELKIELDLWKEPTESKMPEHTG